MADWKKLLDDAVDTIGHSVEMAGDGLRQVADDARKVAGIGRGTISIETERPRYHLGDTVEGVVELRLSEPVEARRLVVAVRATRRRLAVENLASRSRTRTHELEKVFEFESVLGGEQTYESGRHQFEIDLPVELDREVGVDGLLGDALRAVKTVKSMTEGQLKWSLVAFLDIPWKRNVSHAIDLAVREEPRDPFEDLEDEVRQHKTAETVETKRAEPEAKAEPPPPPKAEPPKAEPPPPKADKPPPAATRPQPKPEPPPPAPEPTLRTCSPDDWPKELERTLQGLQSQGWVVIHERRPGPVRPAHVMGLLGQHPDLDAELLQFYAQMDGCEIIVGRPRVVLGEYATVAAAAQAVDEDGSIGPSADILMHPKLGLPLVREFCDDEIRVIEIPPLRCIVTDPVTIAPRRSYAVTQVDRAWWAISTLPTSNERLRWRELLGAALSHLAG